MKKHRKNKAFVLLNPTFKDIIGYQTSYDTSNSVYYTVNKKTGNFKCVSKSDKKNLPLFLVMALASTRLPLKIELTAKNYY